MLLGPRMSDGQCEILKSKQGCIRWALCEYCSDFACGGDGGPGVVHRDRHYEISQFCIMKATFSLQINLSELIIKNN